MDFSGKYIVVEGPDFSGKDTQCRLLIRALEEEGHKVLFIREPGTGWFGDNVRSILLDRRHDALTAVAEMLLFMANRAQILKEFILPSLKEGKIVVSSRDKLSSWAYQGFGRGLSLEMIKLIGNYVMDGMLPDLYVILMASVEDLMQRKEHILELDRIEKEALDFYKRVLRGYQDFIDQDLEMVAVFDATLSPEEIHGQILKSVKRILE